MVSGLGRFSCGVIVQFPWYFDWSEELTQREHLIGEGKSPLQVAQVILSFNRQTIEIDARRIRHNPHSASGLRQWAKEKPQSPCIAKAHKVIRRMRISVLSSTLTEKDRYEEAIKLCQWTSSLRVKYICEMSRNCVCARIAQSRQEVGSMLRRMRSRATIKFNVCVDRAAANQLSIGIRVVRRSVSKCAQHGREFVG